MAVPLRPGIIGATSSSITSMNLYSIPVIPHWNCSVNSTRPPTAALHYMRKAVNHQSGTVCGFFSSSRPLGLPQYHQAVERFSSKSAYSFLADGLYIKEPQVISKRSCSSLHCKGFGHLDTKQTILDMGVYLAEPRPSAVLNARRIFLQRRLQQS